MRHVALVASAALLLLACAAGAQSPAPGPTGPARTGGELPPLVPPGQPAPPPSGPQPTRGPWAHVVMSATSPDGLTWTHDGRVLLEHASVPAAIVADNGAIRLYYVDATQRPETTNCAESRDGGVTFTVLGCTIANRGGLKAVDPSIVRLPDGRWRLYYYASEQNTDSHDTHYVRSALADDGVHFVDEGVAYSEEGLVDPDVYEAGGRWLMAVFSNVRRATIVADSPDGRTFSFLGLHSLDRWGTTAPYHLDDGRLRLYAFNQDGQKEVRSFVSTDGLSWVEEPGVRLEAPEGTQITDPYVVRLPDGTWKMFFKASADR
ncbi:MAG: hypothetical protein AB7N90_17690 [Vicinamibacterales bacterium]